MDTQLQGIKPGQKFDAGKIRPDLLQADFLQGLSAIMQRGAEKYGDNSWQQVKDPENRYYAAAMRHLLSYRTGEIIDPESGQSHLLHVAVNIMFLYRFEKDKEVREIKPNPFIIEE